MVAEPGADTALARELLAILLPAFDTDRLLRALLAERAAQAAVVVGDDADVEPYNAEREVMMRELNRVRGQLAIGDAARVLQHSINNPLTALLAEAQLLEIEVRDADQRAAVRRILELARRMVALTRRLDVASQPGRVG